MKKFTFDKKMKIKHKSLVIGSNKNSEEIEPLKRIAEELEKERIKQSIKQSIKQCKDCYYFFENEKTNTGLCIPFCKECNAHNLICEEFKKEIE